MKKIRRFSIYEAKSKSEICGNTVPSEIMSALRARWPQFFTPDLVGFHLSVESGDSLIDEVIEFLHNTGREPNWNWCPQVTFEHPTLYQVKGQRVWESADIASAEYFQLHVTEVICDSAQLPPDGISEVEFSSYKGSPVGITTTMSNPICSAGFRQELEVQAFKGLAFRPVQIKSRKPQNLVLWQIWSNITLPPVLTPTVGAKGEPFDPKTSIACYVNDIYFPWCHHYEAAEIRKLEPFDVAISAERWGYGYAHRREPALIVSRRFRDWFMTQKVPVEWWPVALE